MPSIGPAFICHLSLMAGACLPTNILSQEAEQKVLQQSVVLQKDGGVVIFQRIEPPEVPTTPAPAPVLTPEEAIVSQRRASKEHHVISLSATLYAGGLTLLYCGMDGLHGMGAVSNVDFRLLAGTGTVETDTQVFTLIMAVGVEETETLPDELAVLAQHLPADGTPAFILTNGDSTLTADEAQTGSALEVLHEYFDTHREVLAQAHVQRLAEQAARELAQRNAPPPPLRRSVVQFWPLQASQRELLRAQAQERRSK